MTRKLVAGVDTSTQSCKVRVTDAETGELVRFGQAKHPNGTSIGGMRSFRPRNRPADWMTSRPWPSADSSMAW